MAEPAHPSRAGSSGLIATPEAARWTDLARANRDAAGGWEFVVAGRSVRDVRALARREALASSAAFSAGLGVCVDAPGEPDGLVVATGHQPEIYHPGVWIKDFALQRLAGELGATAIDVVVDSDGFETLGVSSPCLAPEVRRCTQYLAVGSRDGYYAAASVPSEHDLEEWISAVSAQTATLPEAHVQANFADFAVALRSARSDAGNLAELITYARRRFEAAAGTAYLEFPATWMARTEGYLAFVADIALEHERFADSFNGALAAYRVANRTRNAAQPFPDLARDGERVELPLWLLESDRRLSVWCEPASGGVRVLSAAGEEVALLPSDPHAAVDALTSSGATLAPKALALTLFLRGFVCDLLIHGVGGGRYDKVTDDVFRRYWGVEPPSYVIATADMYLEMGLPVVSEAAVSAARERVNRLAHNPDAVLGEVEFADEATRARAVGLASEKADLVRAIASPDADKKELGRRIREINEEIGGLLGPVLAEAEAQAESLRVARQASEVLMDRTYPLCFWSPAEVAARAAW